MTIEIDIDKQQEIANTIKLLYDPNSIFEIRILNTQQHTVSGYFDNSEAAIYAIEPYIGVHDIYITLNSPDNSLLARSNNNLKPYAKQTTSDNNIAKLNWILVDLDPVRKAGISSTDTEKQEAAILAKNIARNLHAQFGFPIPVICDSGNGYHLLYKIDLENNRDNVNILKDFLRALDFLYSSDKVMVDRTTFNPARIVKLYGTMACKGDNTEERPHRWSCIKKIPDELSNVPIDIIQTVINKLPAADSNSNENTNQNSKGLDVEEWLKDNGLDVAFSADWGKDGVKYILSTCPWREEHTNKSAFVIQFKNGAIAAGCHHNSCQDENWRTLRDKYEPEWRTQNKKSANNDNKDEKETQVDTILRLGNIATFFHDEKDEAFARVPVNNHTEIYKVSSSKFKSWIFHQYYLETGRAFSADSWTQAVGVFTGKALFEGEEKKLFTRCAWYNDELFYDLNNKEKEIVHITKDGWEILTDSAVLFYRYKTMSAQNTPVKSDNDISILDKHYKYKNSDDKLLHVISLITKFLAHVPHPIDVVHGEKGASKSTTLRKDKSIVDPDKCDILVMPKTREDLAILLSRHYFLCFDNLSTISAEMSDLICMASTGGTFIKRTLYSNDDETVLEFMQPVSFNGVNVVATRPDLLDRSIILELERITSTERKTEKELWSEFNEEKSLILGVIFTILSKAMKIFPTIKLKELGRMADFTIWGYAIAEATGLGGDNFLNAYLKNQGKANDEAVDSHPIASAVVKFMNDKKEWNGTATELLRELNSLAEKEQIDTKSYLWSKQANSLSRRLKEVKSNLEQLGLKISISNISSNRSIRIKNTTL